LAIVAAGLSLLAPPAAAREKTDVIVLDNGDRITGEIASMTRGKVDFKTDDIGRIAVEWLQVAQVTSDHVYDVELSSGATYLGPLLPPPGKKQIAVGPNVVPLAEVVAITPIDDEFWSRVRAYLDLGFTLAKSNNATTLSSDGEFAYRGERFGSSLSFDTYLQDDKNSVAVSRSSVEISGSYYFVPWKLNLFASADQNDELALDLRLSLGADASYAAVRNSFMELWVSAGIAGAHEQYVGTSPNLSAAAYFDATWQAFRYSTPKLDSTVEVSVLPVLTDLGRVRGTTTVRFKYEVLKDFNVGLNFSFSFDTRPPDPSASKTDYFTSLTVGWSYRR